MALLPSERAAHHLRGCFVVPLAASQDNAGLNSRHVDCRPVRYLGHHFRHLHKAPWRARNSPRLVPPEAIKPQPGPYGTPRTQPYHEIGLGGPASMRRPQDLAMATVLDVRRDDACRLGPAVAVEAPIAKRAFIWTILIRWLSHSRCQI